MPRSHRGWHPLREGDGVNKLSINLCRLQPRLAGVVVDGPVPYGVDAAAVSIGRSTDLGAEAPQTVSVSCGSTCCSDRATHHHPLAAGLALVPRIGSRIYPPAGPAQRHLTASPTARTSIAVPLLGGAIPPWRPTACFAARNRREPLKISGICPELERAHPQPSASGSETACGDLFSLIMKNLG